MILSDMKIYILETRLINFEPSIAILFQDSKPKFSGLELPKINYFNIMFKTAIY